jgi:hypothetical protein
VLWHDKDRPLFSLPELVTLTSKVPSIPLPSPVILETHCLVAKMLKVSGLGEKISSLMYSVENETHDIIIEEDGSTDLGTILFRHLLMDIPQTHKGIKM